MKNAVVLKSFSSGISIIMDDSLPFDELLEIIGQKFREADSFFKDASVAISLEGRVLSVAEEKAIVEKISENSRITILCLMGRDEGKNIKFLGIENNVSFQKDENCGQFYRGSLKNGQSIETENSIIILGNVEKGCSVYSAKDIVILGGLYGEAHAGAAGSGNHYVAALCMEPESLKIGDFIADEIKPVKGLFKSKVQPPKIAYTYNGQIKVDEITNEVLESFSF